MNLKSIKIPPIHLMISRFFGRFHIVTFTIVILGGLAATTYALNEVVASASEKDLDSSIEQELPNFDSSTIERIENLSQNTGETKPLKFPAGKRPNPFWE